MKQINPLYIALFLVVVLIVMMAKLDGVKGLQEEAIAELEKTELMAKRTVALKKSWEANEQIRKSLNRLLRQTSRNAEIEYKEQQGSMVITAKKINATAAEYLLNKLFNGTYVIKTMKIKRLDSESASLEVEITL
ncbi:MAG: hypothetical protein U9Q62_07385 [Campylobacterota bacterium]|nr:hypothetical protein [Campylobacterota bacterium]